MKTLTVRLPNPLAAEIDAESRARNISKSDVIRERLQTREERAKRNTAGLDLIQDLIGSVQGLPADLSTRKKEYLRTADYGHKRSR